jgi:hypothetical protein
MPLVHQFCAEQGVETVNLQHGERVVSRHIAFMRFGTCHFWAAKYAQVYADTLGAANKILLTGNGMHRRLFQDGRVQEARAKVLLVVHHRIATMGPAYAEQVLRVARMLGPGWTVKVRRHPGDHDLWPLIVQALIEQGSSASVELQEPTQVSIDQAVLEAGIVVGATSTALIEAWIAGAKVLIVPGMASETAAMEAYGGSPNVLSLWSPVTDADLKGFLGSPREDGPQESARIDRITLVSSEKPLPWSPPC